LTNKLVINISINIDILIREETLSKNNRYELAHGNEYLQPISFLVKSLADENRLRILLSLTNGKKSVSSIVEELSLSQPLVSHHLKELRRALLVKVERSGPFIYYQMSDERILDILKVLEELTVDLLNKRKSF
jgi:ArsR family transcriptional regulator, zinc-responsive transcriptional repressor